MPSQGPGQGDRGSAPLPPAVTRWKGANAGNDRGASLAPPFRPIASRPAKATKPAPAKASTQAAPPILPATDQNMTWVGPLDTTGVVEPPFKGDISLTPPAAVTSDQPAEEFPIEAFMITEESKRVPTGLAPAEVEAVKQQTEHPPQDAVHDVADRFEKLSRRLRADSVDTVMGSLALGDRFDGLLAAFLTDYFSKHDA